MKNIFLLFIAIVFLKPASAQTNVYHPFPDSNAIWNGYVGQIYDCHGGMTFYDEYYTQILSGDTIINSVSYHKLITAVAISSDATCPFYHPIGYSGAIRQDIFIKKVFLVAPGDTTEQLLYDFDLQVGDTLQSYIVRDCLALPAALRIYVEDSILIGNNYRKRWAAYSFSGASAFIIEGIGTSQGLLDELCYQIEGFQELTCFSQNGQTLYPDTTTVCNIIDALRNVAGEKHSISLFPNPFHTSAKLKIETKEPVNGNYEFKIYNSIGSLVREEKISQTTSYILNRCALNNGLYFFLLTSKENEQIGSGRFVIE